MNTPPIPSPALPSISVLFLMRVEVGWLEDIERLIFLFLIQGGLITCVPEYTQVGELARKFLDQMTVSTREMFLTATMFFFVFFVLNTFVVVVTFLSEQALWITAKLRSWETLMRGAYTITLGSKQAEEASRMVSFSRDLTIFSKDSNEFWQASGTICRTTSREWSN